MVLYKGPCGSHFVGEETEAERGEGQGYMESSVRLESEARSVWLQRFYSHPCTSCPQAQDKEEVIE